MSVSYISAALRQLVEERAQFRCEYCQTQQLIIGMPLEVEHIVPEVNGGRTDESNLCLACSGCNRHKSSRTEATDRLTDTTVPLFHPRQQHWYEHSFGRTVAFSLLDKRQLEEQPLTLCR